MIKVKKLGVILKPTSQSFESEGVFNPACWQEGETIHLFYRAVDKKHKSSIGYARLKGPTTLIERWQKPIIKREFAYEKHGIEDPEITKMGNLFYFFYVAYNGKNAVTAYATSKDLKKFRKRGTIGPNLTYQEATDLFRSNPSPLKDAYHQFAALYQEGSGKDVLVWYKDVSLFPKKINGKLALIQRILPDIQIVFFNNFKQLKSKSFWRKQFKNLSKYIVLENKYWFESRNIGSGCPPLETKDGWLVIFHTVEEKKSPFSSQAATETPPNTDEKRIYRASAALLDKKNPLKVIGRLKEPLFSPTEEWEKANPNLEVVFPTGTAIFGETLYIYYGAGDKNTAVASVNLNELLQELKKSQ